MFMAGRSPVGHLVEQPAGVAATYRGRYRPAVTTQAPLLSTPFRIVRVPVVAPGEPHRQHMNAGPQQLICTFLDRPVSSGTCWLRMTLYSPPILWHS